MIRQRVPVLDMIYLDLTTLDPALSLDDLAAFYLSYSLARGFPYYANEVSTK